MHVITGDVELVVYSRHIEQRGMLVGRGFSFPAKGEITEREKKEAHIHAALESSVCMSVSPTGL